MSIEVIIVAALVVLGVVMYIKHREKPVDMNHKAPNVHNVVSKTPNGPATASKPVKAKKATKKTATKKKTAKVDLDAMSKVDLLALAKEKGVKANASLKKAELIERLK
jgi:hypothetical protein